VPPDPNYYLDPRKGELGAESANYLYDVAEAKRLVSAAGYANGFDMELTAQGDAGATAVELLQIWQDEIKKAGFVRIQLDATLARTPYLDKVIRTATHRGMGFFSPAAGNDIDYLLFRNYHSSGQAAAYGDAQLDALIEAQRKTRECSASTAPPAGASSGSGCTTLSTRPPATSTCSGSTPTCPSATASALVTTK
jgi:ABC-type transport system substrate-binding protein